MSLTKTVRFAERIIHALNKILGTIAIIVLIAMMIFTDLDVFLRAFFNRPIPGDVEIIEFAMVCTGFLGLGWCAIKGMHVKVELIDFIVKDRTTKIIDCFVYLLGLGICILFTWRSVVEGFFSREMHNLSNVLEIPIYPFYWIVAFSYAGLSLTILFLFLKALKEIIQK